MRERIPSRDIQSLIDRYKRLEEQRLPRLIEFNQGRRPFLVCSEPAFTFHLNPDSPEKSLHANLHDFERALSVASDSLPYLIPWFGTGVWAELFGCEYLWRENESPACHYAYHHIEQIRNLPKPDISKGRITRLVLDTIHLFREVTNDQIPIYTTDTQSTSDTATLVLDASEFFVSCYTESDTVKRFLRMINELIADFTQMQMEAIGPPLARPGHQMANSYIGGRGIALSDDNLAVASPSINKEFFLPLNDELGKKFDGLYLHSCGDFTHSMSDIAKMQTIQLVELKITKRLDPTPNRPEIVRDVFKNTGIITQVRIDSDLEREMPFVERLVDPGLRLILKLENPGPNSQVVYEKCNHYLANVYNL